jgi:hypothetical protein
MNIPFLKNITVFSTISTQNGTSDNWNSTYTAVQSNSGTWNEAGNIVSTTTNYLSTTPVTLSSTNTLGVISSAGTPLHEVFFNTLTFTPSTQQLSISNGTSVALSSLNDQEFAVAAAIALS